MCQRIVNKDEDQKVVVESTLTDENVALEKHAANWEEAIKYVALSINLMLVLCKTIALAVRHKHAVVQSLFDSLGDVIGNIAVIVFREEVGVLLQAIVMGLASVGVMIPSGTALQALAGAFPDKSGECDGSDRLAGIVLILVAILTKGLIYASCWALTRHQGCSIAVRAIREDAVNDVMMNSGALVCAFPEFWLAVFQNTMPNALKMYLIAGMDPAWAFLMSLPILHGWIGTACTQIATLQKDLPVGQQR